LKKLQLRDQFASHISGHNLPFPSFTFFDTPPWAVPRRPKSAQWRIGYCPSHFAASLDNLCLNVPGRIDDPFGEPTPPTLFVETRVSLHDPGLLDFLGEIPPLFCLTPIGLRSGDTLDGFFSFPPNRDFPSHKTHSPPFHRAPFCPPFFPRFWVPTLWTLQFFGLFVAPPKPPKTSSPLTFLFRRLW